MTNAEAIKDLKDYKELPYVHDALSDEVLDMAIQALQEPKTGHWTHDGSHWENRFICSECEYKLFEEQTNYCPNCGAKMVEPQESEG